MRSFYAFSVLVVGCGGSVDQAAVDPRGAVESLQQGDVDQPPPDDPPGSACGDTHEVDLVVGGYVVDASGAAIADTDVWIEERSWFPGTVYGSGTTDGDGWVEFDVTALPIVDGCWAIGPQFYAATADGEAPANSVLVGAWLDGSDYVDASSLRFDYTAIPSGDHDEDEDDQD